MTAVGFEPTPLRTGAWSQRLRPLGQTVHGLRNAGLAWLAGRTRHHATGRPPPAHTPNTTRAPYAAYTANTTDTVSTAAATLTQPHVQHMQHHYIHSIPSPPTFLVLFGEASLFRIFVARVARVPMPPSGDTEISPKWCLRGRGAFWGFQQCMISRHTPFHYVPQYSALYSTSFQGRPLH